jgi:chemotaxis protein MotA
MNITSQKIWTSAAGRKFDRATLIGSIASFSLIILAIFSSGGIGYFFNLPSLLIVIGGTLGATLMTFNSEEFKLAIRSARLTLFEEEESERQRFATLIEFTRFAHKHGPLALQQRLHQESDPFLVKSIELAIDGLSTEEIRRILQIELGFVSTEHEHGAKLFQTMSTIAPAMGLVGTIIGLVHMLQALNSPSQIGPAMAVALLTTFYGVIFAHLIFSPIAGKLWSRAEIDRRIKEMTVEAAVALARGTNPRLVETQLQGFLPQTKDSINFSN